MHTTRKANKAIFTTGQTQIVLFDTPGLVTPTNMRKHKLEQSFQSAYRHAIQNADMIAVLHDVSISRSRNQLHSTVIEALKTYPKVPSFLVVNKVDVLKSKRITLDVIRNLTNNILNSNAKSPAARWMRREANINKKAHVLSSVSTDYRFSQTTEQGSWSNFSEVFLVSAITGHGLIDVHVSHVIDLFNYNSKQ